MISKALARYLKISPKKLRPVARLVAKKNVDEALYCLANTNKKGAGILKGAIESALSNAKRIPEKNFTEENLFISKLIVNGGPMLKRFRAMSMGRAGMIRKRTSHVFVELDLVKGKEATATTKPAAKKKPTKKKKLLGAKK